MSRYSVWDWNARKFAVYDDGRPQTLMADVPLCQPGTRPAMGGLIDIGHALCVLPHDARPVGWSDVAAGRVVRIGAVPASTGFRPGLGGLMFSPGIAGLGSSRGDLDSGMGFSFAEAVVANVAVAIISGIVTTFIFKSAFIGAGKVIK